MPHTSPLARLASLCARRSKTVLGVWVALLVCVSALASFTGSNYTQSFKLPASDSMKALALLQDRFPALSGAQMTVVFSPRSGTVYAPAVKAALAREFAALRAEPEVRGIASPYNGPAGGRQIAPGAKVAFATVQLAGQPQQIPLQTINRLIVLGRSAASPALDVALSGQVIEQAAKSQQSLSEMVGVLAAIVVLLITFGSVVAMGLPIITALIALGSTAALITALTHVLSVVNFAPELAAMIGLGVGIDYALFILTRYRAALHADLDTREAIVQALDTSGRAVLFAGVTVIIALLGMLLLGISFMNGLGISAALAVALTMLASLTLLPALLALLGPRVNRLSVPGLRRRSRHSADGGTWGRWAGVVQRRPWVAAVCCLLVLGALASPVMALRLGSSDASSDPSGSTTRQAYDLLAKGFGAGFNGPLQVVGALPRAGDLQGAMALRSALAAQPGVVSVQGPVLNPARDVALVVAYPSSSPQSAQTTALISRLRARVLPKLRAATGVDAHVGGETALFADLGSTLNAKLPLFIGVVVGLSALLLLVVFRSVPVALKAVAMNLLSIGAAFGVLVAVFQWGWGASLIGVSKTGPVESFLPVMLFAIVFGLSMDYEVFLLSRVHEEWEHSREASRAVRVGLSQTGRVITAAAAIMVMVFGSFLAGDERVIKEFGLGLATAVGVDALLIRCVLVPAILQLLGKRAWWLPAWLERTLPRLSVEPGAHAAD